MRSVRFGTSVSLRRRRHFCRCCRGRRCRRAACRVQLLHFHCSLCPSPSENRFFVSCWHLNIVNPLNVVTVDENARLYFLSFANMIVIDCDILMPD